MMFFFFDLRVIAGDEISSPAEFRSGQPCEIMSVRLPIFADSIGRKIIITKVVPDMRMVWAHDAKPPKYGINRNGKQVTEYDPRCVESLYSFEQLRVINGAEAKELLGLLGRAWSRAWG